jgi:hypothetical protein
MFPSFRTASTRAWPSSSRPSLAKKENRTHGKNGKGDSLFYICGAHLTRASPLSTLQHGKSGCFFNTLSASCKAFFVFELSSKSATPKSRSFTTFPSIYGLLPGSRASHNRLTVNGPQTSFVDRVLRRLGGVGLKRRGHVAVVAGEQLRRRHGGHGGHGGHVQRPQVKKRRTKCWA